MSDTVSPWSLEVPCSGGAYPVHGGAGALDRLADLLAAQRASGYALIADSRVWELHGERVAAVLGICTAEVIAVPSGEAAKCFAVLEQTLDRLAGLGLDRRAFILAMGGGAACDLAGLAASLWMRGVPWGLIPTSLLAQADACVGGKTALNLGAGKNLAGSFHSPRFALIDPSFLATLEARELRSGMAEVVKVALIADRQLFERLEASADWSTENPESWGDAIPDAIRIKASVVARDEREGDLRRILNLGHTVGHGLERVSGGGLRHGEAVAIGLVAACDLARDRGLQTRAEGDRVRRLLRRIGLPTAPPAGVDLAAALAAIALDKKRRGDRLSVVLPAGIGAVRIVEDVRLDELENCLTRESPRETR